MTIKTTQRVISIGTSRGITIPAKDLKKAGITNGDEVIVTVKKANADDEVLSAAKDILKRYKQDFENLANR